MEQLDVQLAKLRQADQGPDTDLSAEIDRLENKKKKTLARLYGALSAWDVVCVARHPQRPHSTDHIKRIITDFQELHGDRCFGDDAAIVCGLGRLNGQPLMVIAQEKGRNTKERVRRNFGMARAEGYRKAQRMMLLAERFQLPVLSLIDTPGAFPGIDAEERGISEAIASNLAVMSRLRTPLICAVIGEGSSGGALGIGVGDHLCMLQFSTYFVISPEGCANIIWKTNTKAAEAAEAMGVTASILQDLRIVDAVVEEPIGGAHRDPDLSARRLSIQIDKVLQEFHALSPEELVERRYGRLMEFGNPVTAK